MTTFDDWIDVLREDVIEGDFGYEPGEFTVYADQWCPMFAQGLSPQDAFQRALDAFSNERDQQEVARQRNWQRIQAEDAKYRAPATPKAGGE